MRNTGPKDCSGLTSDSSDLVDSSVLEMKDDDNCTHFWLNSSGRCCPKHSVTNISNTRSDRGNFYELIEGFTNQSKFFEDFPLLLPLLLFILIILCHKK